MKLKTVNSYEIIRGEQVGRSMRPCPRCIEGQVIRSYAGQEEYCLQCGWSGPVRVATIEDQPRRRRGGRYSRTTASDMMKTPVQR